MFEFDGRFGEPLLTMLHNRQHRRSHRRSAKRSANYGIAKTNLLLLPPVAARCLQVHRGKGRSLMNLGNRG